MIEGAVAIWGAGSRKDLDSLWRKICCEDNGFNQAALWLEEIRKMYCTCFTFMMYNTNGETLVTMIPGEKSTWNRLDFLIFVHDVNIIPTII